MSCSLLRFWRLGLRKVSTSHLEIVEILELPLPTSLTWKNMYNLDSMIRLIQPDTAQT